MNTQTSRNQQVIRNQLQITPLQKRVEKFSTQSTGY